MSYLSARSRSYRATRNDPRASISSRNSFDTRPAGRTSGPSGSAQQVVDLTHSDDEAVPTPASTSTGVIDLMSPSPPPRTSPFAPPRAPPANLRKDIPEASGSESIASASASRLSADQPSNDTSTVASPTNSPAPAALRKETETAQRTPTPQIKESPRSSVQKKSQVQPPPQTSSKGKTPEMLPPSDPSVQKAPQVNSASRSTRFRSQATPPVKESSQTRSSKQTAPVSQPESESDQNHVSEPEHQASSPSTSSEEEEQEEIATVSPSRNLRTSPTPSRKSARSTRESDKSTINSSSPLIPRLKARSARAKENSLAVEAESAPSGSQDVSIEEPSREEQLSQQEQQSQEEQPSQEENPKFEWITASLQSLQQDMSDDHSESVVWLLRDAREGIQSTPDLAVDKVSPFASLKSVQIAAKEKIPNGFVAEALDSFVYPKSSKITKSKSTQLAKAICGETPRVPRYSSHTNVTRNILSPDSVMLKYVPYLGDATAPTNAAKGDKDTNYRRLLKELEEAYSHGRTVPTRQSERASRIRAYLEVFLAENDIQCNMDIVIRYMVNKEEAQNLGLRDTEREMILESFGGPLSEEAESGAKLFWQAFDKVFEIGLPNVMLPAILLKDMVDGLKKAKTSPENQVMAPGERLGTYAELTCLICGAVDCQTHADYTHEEIAPIGGFDDEDQEPEYLDHRQSLRLPYNDMLRRYDVRKKADAASQPEFDLPRRPSRNQHPCSPECYRIHDQDDESSEEVVWSDKDIYALQEMLISMTDKNHRACHIAFALSLPCWQTQSAIEEYEEHNDTTRTVPEPLGRPKRPDWYDGRKKTLHNNFADMTKAHLHQERSQANPCTHEGHCTSKCPCYGANILCESFCGCADDCPRKFTGCSCLGNGLTCVAESCICIQMNRECGPQCISCGAHARINPANKHDDALFTHGCQNVPLQRGVHKTTVVGESQLVGFGLYLAEPVRKGEFISEYTGEVISSQEAERRGITYDRKFQSFLFDLNRDYVIDAAHLGNNTRFINHSEYDKNGLNCEAKIILVNGEHRIKFVALRDVEVGEELLFNYGKKFAEKHGLSKTLPKAKEGRKGVIVGEEALDALDGVADRKKSARVKAKAARGRPRGSRGRANKMRKMAAPARVEVVEEPEVEEDLYAAEMEEDGDEEEGNGEDEEEEAVVEEGRRKRKIIRPARYTR
ncbi:uncharacterized protein LY89DRAFT_667979 [Mollisia scopiformis]|uniref:Uncharacterized protein n=1 Tax=Mollisia scopiformis TaxID=149040 RepID=A0A194XGN6_MOLSC|nr:uncharacterized protein LY89DRAFT_667979 [Mollisia scopiformis]KUJ18932.1 hypothetical protein LY89DRAFT_667979 [Mollisia scopiformis]